MNKIICSLVSVLLLLLMLVLFLSDFTQFCGVTESLRMALNNYRI